ncbi:hypothetical protein GCM10022403_054670 [Streptomyces coacervatus]|uniref:FHA domain-containing protein n=1 Tax=Streptomyces coacervatus TaxID=647381 RepID=A0ABP7IB36_9ACTN|nr:FHA domain-containing protein [Streptomyces coacervatus]MDF2269168.1 FHA domain-containing protein [Streptomyces coacervatus]
MDMRSGRGPDGEPRLSLDAMTADFVVDVANVVRERGLVNDRPADLSRLTLLTGALAEFARDDSVRVYGVCDGSLLGDGRLYPAERTLLARWAAEGRLEVRPVADPRILELVETLDMPAVTGDNFFDEIPDHPWIAGNTDSFLRPVPDASGRGVSVVPRVMPVPQEWQISRKREESDLLASGMYDRRGAGARRELLDRIWRCPAAACPLFGPGRTTGQPLPRHRRGRVLCPTHEVQLTSLGTVPARAQLKVRVDGAVRTRFTVAEGAEITVGRAPAPSDGIALAPWIGEAARIWMSRNHVTIALDGGQVRVRDTSANGTVVRRAGDDVRLRRGGEWPLRTGQLVLLHETVALELSGRRYFFEDPEQGPARPLSPSDSGPTLLHRPGEAPRGRRGRR